MTGSVVVARPLFVARHRSTSSDLLLVLVEVGAVGAPRSADAGDEAFDREPWAIVEL